jgi:hypothetical protein
LKFIDNILYIEFQELLEAGIAEDTIKKALYRKSESWISIADPIDRRKVLVRYETLKDKYKALIGAKYGNPYEYQNYSLIKCFLKQDAEARWFYMTYKTPSGIALPKEYIDAYVKAADWLNLIIMVDQNWSKVKKQLCIEDKPKFFEIISKIITADGIDLPRAYPRLKEKIRLYKEQGYQSLVSKKFGNKNSQKVKEDLNSAYLLELIGHFNQLDDVFIATKYNQFALERNYQTITSRTVGEYRKRNEYLLIGQRQGMSPAYDRIGKVIHRERPKHALSLINSDDNILDLYFFDTERKNYYHRFALIVIVDAYNDYILGFAAGNTVTEELVKRAYLNAIHHVKQLTGEWFIWNQITTDRWGYKALQPFYDAQATYTPATARAARGKIIEQSFGVNWHKTLKAEFINYAGNNITSKSKLNADALERNKRDFPTIEQAPQYIEHFINKMRSIPCVRNKKLTREQSWLQNITNSPSDKLRKIDREQQLLLFGTKHDYLNTITNAGIVMTIEGERMIYEVPNDLYLQTIRKKVQVIYDPLDDTEILAIADGGKLRMVCKSYDKMPMALADFGEGDRARLNSLLEQKKQHGAFISASRDNRVEVLKMAQINAESLIQAGVQTKELKQEAERLISGYTNNEIDPTDRDFLNDM